MVIVFTKGFGYAQTAGKVDQLSLEKSIEIALGQNPEILAAKAKIRSAKFAVSSARSKIFPKLSGDLYGAKVFNENNDILSSNVTLKQLIFDGGKTSASLKSAENNIIAQETELVKIEKATIEKVKKAYYTFTAMQDLLTIREEAVTQLKQHLKDILSLYNKGVLPKVEVLKVELAETQAEQQLIDHRSDIDINRATFNQLLGRDLSTEVKLEPLLEYVPISISFEEWLRIGLANRPELAQIENAIKDTELQIKMVKSEFYPQLSILGRYEREKDIYINTSRVLSAVSATMNIWDWGNTKARVNEARTKVEESNYSKQTLKSDIELELQKAYFVLMSGQQKIELARKIIDFADEFYRMQSIRFKNGQATNTEVLDAQFGVTKARVYYATLVNAFRMSQATAELMLGINTMDLREKLESKMDDEEFLDLVARKAFDYFLHNQNSKTGLFADTVHGDVSIAVTGFGLTALCIGSERGWINKQEAKKRSLLSIRTFLRENDAKAEGKDGFFYHFLKMETAKRAGKSEVSSIDTALLICGAITAGEYFGGDVKKAADRLYAQVEWPKFLNQKSNLFFMGWTPEEGFLKWQWDAYTDETLLVNLLAIGSPKHPVSPEVFYAWPRTKLSNGKRSFVPSWQGALFTYQYAHAWFDFKNLIDKSGLDWWKNSVEATLASIEFCEANSGQYKGYGADSWGVTAYDTPGGYVMNHGFSPSLSGHPVYDGTISPSGSGGSVVFTPTESTRALRHFYKSYPQLWGIYGFKDSFNLDNNWFSTKYFGLGEGIILLMIENYRSGMVWRCFMNNDNMKAAMKKAEFQLSPK